MRLTIYCFRHGPSETRDRSRFPDDSLRPLTEKGKKKTRRVAEAMVDRGIDLDRIWTSPFTRAMQTAEILADVYDKTGELVTTETLTPSRPPEAVVRELLRAEVEKGTVALVGHNPHLKFLIAHLTTGEGRLAMRFKKAGLCRLGIDELSDGPCAILEALLRPNDLLEPS